MKQTAVEWLVDCLNNYDSKMIELFNYEIQRAKEMEKQQIVEAYIRGNYKSNRDMYWKIESAEKNYNETYNK